jgi:transcriptional regulator with XRE-family HTH domain|nr:MAG TPA: Cro/C1-type HTH DNA-binding domain protein [Caudoviricetes sp.]
MLKSPIVARINTLLAQKGIQKKDFFSACGITSATFSQWNTGEIKSPRKKSLKRVADFLGVSVEYLLYGDGAEKESAPDPKTEGVDDKIVQFIRSASAEELTEILRYIDFLESKRKKP